MKVFIVRYIAWFCLSLYSIVNAQVTFQKTFGGTSADIAYSVQQTIDGGYIIAGYTTSFGAGNRDVYLIRTDAGGNTLWTRTYGGSNTDYAWTVSQTADNGFIVGAHTGSFGAGSHDVYLLKCDPFGGLLWTKVYGGSSADGAYSMQETSDGGFIVSAHTSSIGAGQHEVYLIKTDSNGDTLWTRSYGGSNGDYLRSVHQTSDGGYISVSETFSFGAGSADVYLVRTDSLGNLLWAQSYGGTSADYGYSVRQTTDEGYIVAGYTSSFGAGGFDVYLIKTDKDGVLLWSKTYGGSSSDYGYSVKQIADGGYVIAGHTQSFGIAGDVYLIKTDSAGNLIWSKTYGGANSDYGWSMQPTIDGGYVIAGHTASYGAGNIDVYLIKTDEFGNSGCNESTAAFIVGNSATVVSTTQTIVSSGSIIGSTTTISEIPVTVDGFLCSNDACQPCLAGDVNHSGGMDPIDISDLTYLVAFMFGGGLPPPCLDEANVNGAGEIDISDLTYFVAFMFGNGQEPLGCP